MGAEISSLWTTLDGKNIRHVYSTGDTYVGDFKNGQRNGHGVYTSVQGHQYDGAWKDDHRHGVGTLSFAMKSEGKKGETKWAGTYKGQWSHNLKHGKGVFSYQNGDKYEGDWFKGLKHGSGIYTYESKDRYEGQFESNYMHGIGTLFFTNGDRLTGTWVKDQLDGEAISITADGTKTPQWYHRGQQVSSEAQLHQERQRFREQEQQRMATTTRPSRRHGEDEIERSRNRGIPRKTIPIIKEHQSDEGTELMPMGPSALAINSSSQSASVSSSSSQTS